MIMVVIIFLLGVLVVSNGMTGSVINDFENKDALSVGPSVEDVVCLETCVRVEKKSEDICIVECGIDSEPDAISDGESCMQECVYRGCDKYDVQCINRNRGKCEVECGMIGEPDVINDEERCIRDCVNKVDSNIICSSGSFEGEGEVGNEVCQKCASSCEYLYSGPCLSDEEWKERELVCSSQCEYCYGEPVVGSSGQGWECTVDVKCIDASSEFGGDGGAGEDNYEEVGDSSGIIESIGNAVGDFFEGIGKLFSGGDGR